MINLLLTKIKYHCYNSNHINTMNSKVRFLSIRFQRLIKRHKSKESDKKPPRVIVTAYRIVSLGLNKWPKKTHDKVNS